MQLLLRGGANAEAGQRRGSCRSSRRGRAVPRHVRRQGRGGEARGHAAAAGRRSLLRSRRASACLRPRVCSACLRLRGCLGRVRRCACLSGQDSSRVLRPLRTPGRPRAPAAARTKSAQARSAHALHAQLRLRLRGERGRRVCRTSCVCVCGLMLSSVYFAYFAYCACGCARAGSRRPFIVLVLKAVSQPGWIRMDSASLSQPGMDSAETLKNTIG